MLTANDIGTREIAWDSARRTTRDAFNTELTSKSRPKPHDILITKDGTLGRVALFEGPEACINQSVAMLRTKDNFARPAFVVDCLASEPYQHKILLDAGGTTIKHIYITRIVKMSIAPPPLEEQARIQEYTGRRFAGVHSMTGTLAETMTRLREYRAALITAAVTGQLDLRKHEKQMEAIA